MAEIYIGTSGYDYPDWRGLFYAPELPREEFLAFYAEHFNALELNYTYYGMPDERQIAAMVRRSNGRLRFSVKAHKTLTHEISVSAWRDAAKEFRAALTPMTNRELLLSVLFQFPQSFHYAVDERRYLDSLMREFEGFPRVVEFRHDSWQNGSVFERVKAGLADRGIGWCVTDMPTLRHLPSFRPVATGSAAYIRFHGRNAGTWHGTNARDRYDYLYSDGELESFLPAVTAIAATAQVVQIYFNNHAKGQAVVNARKMKILCDPLRGPR